MSRSLPLALAILLAAWVPLAGSCGGDGGETSDGSNGEAPDDPSRSPGWNDFVRAKELEDQELLERALEHYRLALQKDPGTPILYVGLAGILLRLQRLEDSSRVLAEGTARHPDDAQLFFFQGLVLANRSLVDEAVAALLRSVELDGEDAEAWFLLGKNLYGQARVFLGSWVVDRERIAEAIDAFEHAVELAPEVPRYRFHLGQACEVAYEDEAALGHFEQTIGLDPGHAEAHRMRGLLLREAGRIDDALGALRRAVELDEGEAEAHYELGLALQEAEDLGGARDAFQRATALDVGHHRAYFGLSKVLRRLERDAEADAAFARFEEWKAFDARLQELRGLVFETPDDPELRFRLGQAYVNVRRWEEARRELGRVLMAKPDHAGARHLWQEIEDRR
ncbi:MAG: tetratricopeptide repeat protein [Planctomycetota bacterium]|nr:tetratricopeptide repeat protein [Planctomycetota bacterium]